MLITSQPQQHLTRRVARTVRAVPVNAGRHICLNRLVGSDGLTTLDPFLIFDELTAGPFAAIGGDFPEQTHRGFDSLTYIVKGRMRYEDNAGRRTTTETGGLQWLNSGRGLIHSEQPELADGEFHAFQLWLNVPGAEKMQTSAFNGFTAADIPAVIFRDAEVRVLAGRYHGLQGPVSGMSVNPFISDIILKPEGEITLPVPAAHTGLAYVYEGGVSIGQNLISRAQAGILGEGNWLNIAAGQKGGRLLLLTAQPLNEPIVRHGPFIMTSHAEIKQAFTDYQNGLF